MYIFSSDYAACVKYEQNSLNQQTIRLKQSRLLQSLLKRVSVFVSDINLMETGNMKYPQK